MKNKACSLGMTLAHVPAEWWQQAVWDPAPCLEHRRVPTHVLGGLAGWCWSPTRLLVTAPGKTNCYISPKQARASWLKTNRGGWKRKPDAEGNHSQFQKKFIELVQNHSTWSTCCCLKYPQVELWALYGWRYRVTHTHSNNYMCIYTHYIPLNSHIYIH